MRALIVALAALALPAPALAHDGGPRVPDWKPVSVAAQQRAEPPIVATPRADCLPGSVPEGPMQGRVPAGAEGYRCNLSVVGQAGETGGFRVHRYVDRDGHECAYYDTTLLFPTNALSLSGEPTGVAVLDMTDPAKPVHTTTLITPAMQTPHESVNISVERGLLAAVMGNPAFAPGVVDVYDISRDCRHPALMASAPASVFGHESGMALDGKTFYPTSIGTDQTTAVDLSDPRLPRPIWQGQFNTHGMSVSDDGNRGYLATGDGLVIIDLSEVQARKPNPQVREISRLDVVEHDDPADRHPGDDRAASPTWWRSTSTRRASRAALARARAARGGGADHRHLRRAKPVRGLQHPARGPPAREPRRDRRRPRRPEPGAGLCRRTTATCRSGQSPASWPAR